MTAIQQVITIAIAAITNFITRWLPFQLFERKGKSQGISPFIDGLGKFLPPAIMGMLGRVLFSGRRLSQWLSRTTRIDCRSRYSTGSLVEKLDVFIVGSRYRGLYSAGELCFLVA